MLETGLAAAFGFFAAFFLALFLAPAIARRISDLTWRQATRVLPQSSEEIAAARDHLRGQNAIEMRQLEMKMEAVAEKERLLRIGKQAGNDQIASLQSQSQMLTGLNSKLELESARLLSALNEATEQNALLATDNADRDIKIANIGAEFTRLRNDHARQVAAFGLMDEAHKQASQRLENMSNEASLLRSKLSSSESQLRITRSESKRYENDIKLANRKISALEAKLERSIRFMAEAEEKLEQRETELKRYKDQAKPGALKLVVRPLAQKLTTPRPQNLQALPKDVDQKSELIVSTIKILRPALRLAARANQQEQSRIKADMMDLAGRITAEAATQNASLRAKIAQLQPDGSALADAILKYTKTAAE